MQTDPPIDYLSKLTDKELYKAWERRVNSLNICTKEGQENLWPKNTVDFWEEEIDRVEKEMASRNLPIPGEDTFKDK